MKKNIYDITEKDDRNIFRVKKARPQDAALLANLAVQMWNEHTPQELEEEFARTMSEPHACFFLAYIGDFAVGFAQCQLRSDYVEGTHSSPAGYLEGIYVQSAFRHRGYAGALLKECEKWAKDMGCREFASDCELENTDSPGFHRAMGFREANRIICFVKEL